MLLFRAVDVKQRASVGNQTYALFKSGGVEFYEGPWDHSSGKVAGFGGRPEIR